MTRYLMDTLPICEAISKQSKQRCKNFSTKDKRVCRFHGGLSTGVKTPEGKLKQKMASWKNGMRSKEALEEARQIRNMINQCKQLIAET
jgi:hypothetical protein